MADIRRLLARDKIMASLSPAGYVQAVLVPEIGLRLVMEDMHVEQDEARQIMRESKAIGDLLNEEQEDKGRGLKHLMGGNYVSVHHQDDEDSPLSELDDEM